MVTRATDERRLYVGWRDPETRRIWPVGVLVQRESPEGTRFLFAYLRSTESLERFRPFASFPDLHDAYESNELFPLFSNRVMPSDREDFGSYLEQLDLDTEPEPIEILARSGGWRATDRIEVFPEPEFDELTGRFRCRFFARGIRHIDGAAENVLALEEGDPLELVPEPDNEVNERALLLRTRSGGVVGYVPDYLTDFLHDMRETCEDRITVTVEHVNPPDTPAHLRLLCRLETCAPADYEPFRGGILEPLVSLYGSRDRDQRVDRAS